jgi:hypothetical protein
MDLWPVRSMYKKNCYPPQRRTLTRTELNGTAQSLSFVNFCDERHDE